MDYIINKFAIVDSVLTLDIEYPKDTEVSDYDVQFKLADGETLISEAEMVIESPEIEHGIYSYGLTDIDGIFTAIISYRQEAPIELVLGNLYKGNACLLTKVLKENYDCLLFQQLEATKQFVLVSNDPLARDTYTKVLQKCASCVVTNYSLMGVLIQIEDGAYVIT